jgi:plastocyanin
LIKRLFSVSLMIVALLFSAFNPVAAATITKSDLKVLLDGNKLSFAQTYIVDKRLVVPYRAIAEELGATVDYRASDKSVTVTKGNKTLRLKIGSNIATVNGKSVTLDVSATLISNSTYVPIRFLSENLGVAVKYNTTNRTVSLTSQNQAETYQVAIKDFAFSPSVITISKGSKIVFTNGDTAIHTVTARDGSFNSGNMSKGETYTRTFNTPGEYILYCIPHDFMEIKVIVK